MRQLQILVLCRLGLLHFLLILTFFRHLFLISFHVMYVLHMVLWLEQLLCHIGIYARILNIVSEVLYVPFHHCTSQLGSSILVLLLMLVLHYCVDPYILNNTKMIQPIVALYLFLFLLFHGNVDILYLSILHVLQVVILHFLLVHSLLHLANEVVILLLELVPNHIFRNIPLELVLPNNVVLKIPSHEVYSLLFFLLNLFLLCSLSLCLLLLLMLIHLRNLNL